MKTHQEKLQLKTNGDFHVIDITSDVEKAIINSEITEGFAVIYSPHTTCGVMVNEKETGLLADIKNTLARLVPQTPGYQHDDFTIRTENMHPDETENAHSHLRHLIGGKTSECVPITGGDLMLGQWQRVMVVEFDHDREREIYLNIYGE